jgi:hypothetical protein
MTRRTALAGNIISKLLVGLSIFWTAVLGPLTGMTTPTVLFVFAIPFFIFHAATLGRAEYRPLSH